MDHPYYTVAVTNLSRGWTYYAVEGQDWDPADDVVLLSPLTYSWGFKNGLLPAQLEAFTATIVLAARTASDVPETQVGDIVAFSVRIGTDGPYIVAPPPMRATEPEVELTPKAVYSARVTIQLTDLSVDWRGKAVGPPIGMANPGGGRQFMTPRLRWRERGAEIAATSGVPIGCPTWWNDHEMPPYGSGTFGFDGEGVDRGALTGATQVFDGDLEKVLETFINSHQPNGLTHSWVTTYGGFPSGYRRIGPDLWGGSGAFVPVGIITEPESALRVEAVPASRVASGSLGLPMRLAVVDDMVTVVPRVSSVGNLAQFGIDAGWCIVPAKARRARETATNTVRMNVRSLEQTGETDGAGAPKYQAVWTDRTFDSADVATRGPLPRDLPTQLQDEHRTDGTPYNGFEPRPGRLATVAARYTSDQSALDASWTYDAFTVHSKQIPQAYALTTLPRIAPRLPDEPDGDGSLVRAVTVFDLEPRIRFGTGPVNGFIVAGTMQIVGGDMVWTLSTAPGRPVWSGAAPEPVTVDEFQYLFGSLTFADLDPSSIVLGDLDLVEAP